MKSYEDLKEKAYQVAVGRDANTAHNAGAITSIAFAILALAEAIKYHADTTAPISNTEREEAWKYRDLNK